MFHTNLNRRRFPICSAAAAIFLLLMPFQEVIAAADQKPPRTIQTTTKQANAPRVDIFSQHAVDYIPAIATSYNKAVSLRWPGEPGLNIQVFNTASPIWREILRSTTGRTYETQDHDFVMAQYYPSASLNGITSPLCFIGFNGDRAADLDAYDTMYPSGYADLFLYLHEISHCIFFDISRREKTAWKLNPQKDELLADAFAIAYFLQAKMPAAVEDIMRQQGGLPDADPHKDVASREKFIAKWSAYLSRSAAPSNALELFQKTRTVLSDVELESTQ